MKPSAPVSCQPQRPEPLPRARLIVWGRWVAWDCGGLAEGLGASGLGDGNEEGVCMLGDSVPFRGCPYSQFRKPP